MKEASIEEFMEAVQKAMVMEKDREQWWKELAQGLSPQERGYFINLGKEGIIESTRHHDPYHLKLSIQIGMEMTMEQELEQKKKAQIELADSTLYMGALERGIYPLERRPNHPLELQKLKKKIEKANPARWKQLMWLYDYEKLEGYEFLVLDRWREWFPNMVYHLHLDILFPIMCSQMKMELAILDTTQAQIQRAEGITDLEQLQQAQINLYYYLIVAPPKIGKNYNECLEKDKKWMAQSNMSLERLMRP
ncbi:hypothetical protein [Helicobacter bizzozeronii]|uniref:Uncharacterized protein n=1 Tax=Helicobacter bizzozeronii (strain CIII-1) TaxID=1002804 RepID=F8KPG6_HELBC|nr:hypothetical protein [Helicobacter bizzozeronii]CCB80690.1 hypothetical protein HBZC1_17040 [Helicobacter bizzozeronii CIII-1]